MPWGLSFSNQSRAALQSRLPLRAHNASYYPKTLNDVRILPITLAQRLRSQFLITGSCDITFMGPKLDVRRKIAQSV